MQPVVQQSLIDPAQPGACSHRTQHKIVVMNVALRSEGCELLPEAAREHEIRSRHEHVASQQGGRPVSRFPPDGFQLDKSVDPPVRLDRHAIVIDQADVAADQITAAVLEHFQAARQATRRITIVRVENCEIIAAGIVQRELQACMGAQIRFIAPETEARILDGLQHRPAFIRRGVVANQDFQLNRLRQCALDRLSDIRRMVIGRDDDTYEGRGHELLRCDAEKKGIKPAMILRPAASLAAAFLCFSRSSPGNGLACVLSQPTDRSTRAFPFNLYRHLCAGPCRARQNARFPGPGAVLIAGGAGL